MKYLRLMISTVLAIPQWPCRMPLWYLSMISGARTSGTTILLSIQKRPLTHSNLGSRPSEPSGKVWLLCVFHQGSLV